MRQSSLVLFLLTLSCGGRETNAGWGEQGIRAVLSWKSRAKTVCEFISEGWKIEEPLQMCGTGHPAGQS